MFSLLERFKIVSLAGERGMPKNSKQKGTYIMAKHITRLAVSDFTATEKDLIQGLVRIVIQETMKGFTNE